MNCSLKCLLLLLSVVAGANAADPNSFPAKRSPYPPVLLTDNHPALCGLVLAKSREWFLSKKSSFDFRNRDLPKGFEKLDLSATQSEQVQNPDGKAATLSRAVLDLEGTGKRDTILLYSYNFNWRGDWHYGMVASNDETLKQLDSDTERFVASMHALVESRTGKTDALPGVTRIYPDGQAQGLDSWWAIGSKWEPLELLRWREGYYFFDGRTGVKPTDSTVLRLFQLQAGGGMMLRCAVDLTPPKKN